MATVKDGMKLALGWLLFKFLLGLGSCALGVGALSYFYYSAQDNRSSANAKTEVVSKEVTPENPSPGDISFSNGCNVRAEPKSDALKIGFAEPLKDFKILDRQGKWLKIQLPDGKVGWTGCSGR